MLTGRGREEELLERLLDGARAGRSGVVAFLGEAGVGKSALLDHAESRAAGMHVLRARGVQSEARIPFAGLFELLRPALDHLDRLAPPQREALEAALALRPARTQDRFAIGAAALGLLAAQAEDAPLLVLVDDAHWLDGSSADALLFAFRRLVADSIAVVLSVREGEPSLLEGTDLPVHRLDGLDREATAELIAQRAPAGATLTDDLIDRLHRGTGGNPLALIELARDETAMVLDAALPSVFPVGTRVAAAYVSRCETLAQPAREMLLLAAVSDAGDLPILAKAAALAGLDVDDLAAAEELGLISLTGDRLEFRHPLVRSAIYGDAPGERRRLLHRAMADALPDADADRRAWHLALAALGPDAPASSALEQAASRALGRSAYDVASHAFERAAMLATDDGRRGALLLAAADSAWLGGLAARAVSLLDASPREVSDDVATRVDHLRGHIATRLGPVGEGHRILLEGADRCAPVDANRAVVMLAEAVNAAFYAGDVAGMRDAARRIGALLPSVTTRRAEFFGTIAQGMVLIFGGDDEREGAAKVRAAVALFEGFDELSDDPRLLAWAAMGPLWLRESESRRPLVDQALDVARRQSVVGVLPFLLSHVAVEDVAADRWAKAEAGFQEAIALARESGQRTDLAFALARLAWLEARQGREADCRAHAADASVLVTELGLGLAELWLLAVFGDLDLGLGRLDGALARFEELHEVLSARDVGDVDLSPEPELVELTLRMGRVEEAAAHLASFERVATAKGQPWALARAARCRGLLAPDDEIDRHFGDALRWHEQTPDAFETARTRLAYGRRLRRARQRVRSREQLRAALAAFEHLGANPWADLARNELAATGETARRRDVSTRDQLTPQELQIALLLAAGETTREAAAALFLSPKTIEYHQRSIYRKLGVASRAELATAMPGANGDR